MIDYVDVLYASTNGKTNSANVLLFDDSNNQHTCFSEDSNSQSELFNCNSRAAREVRIVTKVIGNPYFELKKIAILSQNQLVPTIVWNTPA